MIKYFIKGVINLAENKLDELRIKINEIDSEVTKYFTERMELVSQVAKYKMENDLPIFQPSREDEIIKKIRNSVVEDEKNACEVLFKTVMDISKCKQSLDMLEKYKPFQITEFNPLNNYKIACQGRNFSYSHMAIKKLFSSENYDENIEFYPEFEDVFKAIENGEADLGILPIQNSTVGSVWETYNLMQNYDFFITYEIAVKAKHCFATRQEVDVADICDVYSHPQALAQCSEFIKRHNYIPVSYKNTALAAEKIANSDGKDAVICSELAAKSLNLKIIEENIANSEDNYTRFICISKKMIISELANVISVSLTLPHTSGALYRLLTKFSVMGLNLLRIESRPIASKDFDVLFYLDFEGNIRDEEVERFIHSLGKEVESFKFLGNYCKL